MRRAKILHHDTNLMVKLPSSLKREAQALAKRHGISVSRLVRLALVDLLRIEEKPAFEKLLERNQDKLKS